MNTTTATVSKINFFGEMIGSPVFILINTTEPVAQLISDIIEKENITHSIIIGTLHNGAENLVSTIEYKLLYPDVVIVDDWVNMSDLEYLLDMKYFTVITMKLFKDDPDLVGQFDYIVDNRGSKEMLETTLTGIIKDLFRKE